MMKLFLLFSATFLSVSAHGYDVAQWISGFPVGNTTVCEQEHKKLWECVRPYRHLFNIVFKHLDDPNVYYDIDLMKHELQAVKQVRECLGNDLKCDFIELMAYYLDTANYFQNTVYGDAFQCVSDAKAIMFVEDCYVSMQEEFNQSLNNRSDFSKTKRSILDCAARKVYSTPSCTIDRIVELYKAGSALLDWYYMAIRMNKKYPFEAEKFDAGKYC